jgi:hypothetical protein
MEPASGRDGFFISQSTTFAAGLVSVCYPRALAGCRERQVKNLHIVHDAIPRAPDVARTSATDRGAGFTSTEFFKDAGTVIAVCLGLGLLMRILLG